MEYVSFPKIQKPAVQAKTDRSEDMIDPHSYAHINA